MTSPGLAASTACWMECPASTTRSTGPVAAWAGSAAATSAVPATPATNTRRESAFMLFPPFCWHHEAYLTGVGWAWGPKRGEMVCLSVDLPAPFDVRGRQGQGRDEGQHGEAQRPPERRVERGALQDRG